MPKGMQVRDKGQKDADRRRENLREKDTKKGYQ
jgi:hypothetical protein